MATAGPNYIGTGGATNDASVGLRAWTNLANVEGSTQGTHATAVSVSNVADSQRLKGQGFGFAIPAGAAITGITVEVRRYQSAANLSQDLEVRLLIADALSGSNKATTTSYPSPSTNAAYATYGGPADTWGIAGLTGADINNALFGVAFRATGGNGTGTTVGVDAIRVTVDYTVSTVSGAVTDTATSTDSATATLAIGGQVTDTASSTDSATAKMRIGGQVNDYGTSSDQANGTPAAVRAGAVVDQGYGYDSASANVVQGAPVEPPYRPYWPDVGAGQRVTVEAEATVQVEVVVTSES